ncbi:hypothetical protein A2415_02705 [candidate division WWE3 bacterium RIFOXYC1_FULL_39_7]|uniref:Uncharacterized protein n=2 Tax=Katanobacteria TaxID=422282 RepID=A0A1F4X4P6_UNCKA|nr:MAG: hypothetical protein A2415_02705 [candidate division WWE3 bacterium RIFOXYC1_FULL_39_7]OGC76637.1 MAG: hypothetical protein A2619_04275 [candidate division WWE3 bacterium RIFOXYD1_FULL_39_9]
MEITKKDKIGMAGCALLIAVTAIFAYPWLAIVQKVPLYGILFFGFVLLWTSVGFLRWFIPGILVGFTLCAMCVISWVSGAVLHFSFNESVATASIITTLLLLLLVIKAVREM